MRSIDNSRQTTGHKICVQQQLLTHLNEINVSVRKNRKPFLSHALLLAVHVLIPYHHCVYCIFKELQLLLGTCPWINIVVLFVSFFLQHHIVLVYPSHPIHIHGLLIIRREL